MNSLYKKKCVPCEGGVPPLSEVEIKNFLKKISPSWKLANNKLQADFKFENFRKNIAFVNKIAKIAETEKHHPDIIINYNKLRLELSTHAINGLSENDFILAAKIDKIKP